MALTGTEETDLILPLLGAGSSDSVAFTVFLDRLRRRSGADHVSVVLRMDGTETIIRSGRDLDAILTARGEPSYHDANRPSYDQLRPGRVYAIAELIEHDPLARAERARALRPLAIADERVVRLTGTEDWSAWLVLARTTKCSAEDSALLSSLSPYISAAIDQHRRLLTARRKAAITAAGLTRSGHGWVLFDAEARIVDIDTAFLLFWTRHGGVEPRIGQRLFGVSAATQRMLSSTATTFSRGASRADVPIVLLEAPRVEMLLSAPPERIEPGMILGVCSIPRGIDTKSALRFATVHGLPLREAQLALELAGGKSLAEAGADLGLTLETTRNYSKRLYAALGVRGQAELVRCVYEGTAFYA